MKEPANVVALERQIAELLGEVDRYRTAAEEALGQVDWCIGYFTAQRQHAIAKSLNTNRSYIRSHWMQRAEQPLPTADAGDTPAQGEDRIPRQPDGPE